MSTSFLLSIMLQLWAVVPDFEICCLCGLKYVFCHVYFCSRCIDRGKNSQDETVFTLSQATSWVDTWIVTSTSEPMNWNIHHYFFHHKHLYNPLLRFWFDWDIFLIAWKLYLGHITISYSLSRLHPDDDDLSHTIFLLENSPKLALDELGYLN